MESDDVSRVNRAAFESARAYSAEGATWHPQKAAFPIDEAVLHLRLLGDVASAERSFEWAQSYADTPFFVGRVWAEFLIKLGREREALAFLESEPERLPRSDRRSMVEVVEQRIADLRVLLGETG